MPVERFGDNEYGTHIIFIPGTPNKKTKTWRVASRETNKRGEIPILADIRWFGRWRKYCFFPFYGTVFEQVCLREIALFVERKTKEHRATKREAKQHDRKK